MPNQERTQVRWGRTKEGVKPGDILERFHKKETKGREYKHII